MFQICTLNESRALIRKRQEIGRGLRLPVRENGERSFDTALNRLIVIANESYADFARQLQQEISDECGVSFEGRVKNKRDRVTAKLKKDWRLDPDFQRLWDRIKHRTRYNARYDTADLIARAATELKQMTPITPPKFRIEINKLRMAKSGITGDVRAVREVLPDGYQTAAPIPDLLGYLQRDTELTRATLADILIASGRLGEVAANPQQFLDQALAAIRKRLHDLMVNGIRYERVAGAEYEMLLFEEKEISGYADRMVGVQHSIYDTLEYDSPVELAFAQALDKRDDIKLFLKLPDWFTIETPLGTYNPDWAIVKFEDGDEAGKCYLVRETKGVTDWYKLPETQRQKILCGQRHFDALAEADASASLANYKWVSSAMEI